MSLSLRVHADYTLGYEWEEKHEGFSPGTKLLQRNFINPLARVNHGDVYFHYSLVRYLRSAPHEK